MTPEEVIRQRRKKLADKTAVTSFFSRLAAFLILMWLLFGAVFGIAPMKNDDMKPRLSVGDLMLFYRLENTWHTQDIIVFEKNGVRYTGRIIAMGGDTVEITDNAELKINNSTVVESDIYYSTGQYEDSDVTYPVTLGKDQFFVLCDYREGAKDSRYFGPVSLKEVKGKVISVIRRSNL